MTEAEGAAERTLTCAEGPGLRAVPSGRDGIEEDLYVVDADSRAAAGTINRGGAWRDLVDGDAMPAALDQLGREAAPTPPITTVD